MSPPTTGEMPARRLIPHALVVLAAVLVVAPAARAALPDPVWSAPDAVAATGVASSGNGLTVLATPTGGAVVIWGINDGHQGVEYSYRPPGGTWQSVQRMGSADHDIVAFDAVARANGDVVFGWTDGSAGALYAAVLDGATGQRATPQHVADGGCTHLASDTAGNVFLVYCSSETYLAELPAGSSSEWGTPEAVTGGNTADSEVHVAPNGDVTVLYTTAGPTTLWATTRPAGASVWSTPVELGHTPDNLFQVTMVSNSASRVTAAWVVSDNGSYARLFTASRDADSGTWGMDPDTHEATEMVGGSGFTYVPGLAVDGNGAAVLDWFNNNGMGAFNVYSSTLGADATTWSTQTLTPAGEGAGHIGLANRPDGSMYSLMLHGSGFPFSIGVLSRGATDGVWTAPHDFPDQSVSLNDGGGVGTDAEGNVILAWESADGAPMVAVGDGAGPKLNDLSVPATASVGDTVSFSVAPADTWSDVASTNFSFGDGTQSAETSPTHVYTAAGTYSVTVRSTDGVGNVSTATRTIVVDGPAGDEPEDVTKVPDPPKKVLPPAPPVEALLAAKQITVNAKVALRKGRACSGKVVATTRFGTTTYRATLALRKVGADCRATGTIRLRKAPSLRTRLRVALSGSATKPRTVTTTRG